VKGNEIGAGQERAVQAGDVAAADEDFGMLFDGRVIKEGQEAGRAVTTAQAEDGFDLTVKKHFHEVGGARRIAPARKPRRWRTFGASLGWKPSFASALTERSMARGSGGALAGATMATTSPRRRRSGLMGWLMRGGVNEARAFPGNKAPPLFWRDRWQSSVRRRWRGG